MKKVHIEKIEVNEEITDDIICNKCGSTCKTKCGNYEGLIETQVYGGYDALLGDMVRYTFSICEICLKDMFDKFKIPPFED